MVKDQVKASDLPDDVFNDHLKAAMKSKDGKLKLSKEEQENFTKAMEKPEFTKLMKEYMDEISDPKYREEQEAYLRQLEADNKVPGHMKLIYPDPGFCIKAFRIEKMKDQSNKNGKLFINVCTSNEIGTPSHSKTDAGVNWQLPFSLGPLRHEHDNAKNPQPTFDFCLHPSTVHQYGKNPRFHKMIMDTALDAVEARIKEVLSPDVSIDRETARVLRNVKCIGGKPAVMQIGEIKNSQPEAVTEMKKIIDAPSPAENSAKAQALVQASKEKPANEPKFTLLHRGHVDIADFVEGVDRTVARRPKELVLKIAVPKLKSAKFLDIETSELSFKLTTIEGSKADYKLEVPLPYSVDADNGTAKFDKTTRVLEIVLPVARQSSETYPLQPPLITEIDEGPKTDTVKTNDENQNESELLHTDLLGQEESSLLEAEVSLPKECSEEKIESLECDQSEERNSAELLAEQEHISSKEALSQKDVVENNFETSAHEQKLKAQGDVQNQEDLDTTPTLTPEEQLEYLTSAVADIVPGEPIPDDDLARMLKAVRKAAELPLPRAEDYSKESKSDEPDLSEDVEATKDSKDDEDESIVMVQHEDAVEDFVSCETFETQRTGMVFKLGPKGLGYYADVEPELNQPVDAETTFSTSQERSKIEHQKEKQQEPEASSLPSKRLQLTSREVFELD